MQSENERMIIFFSCFAGFCLEDEVTISQWALASLSHSQWAIVKQTKFAEKEILETPKTALNLWAITPMTGECTLALKSVDYHTSQDTSH